MKIQRTLNNLKADIFLLYAALRDRRTPWYARAVAVITVLYALSPVDLIPDFIPVIGYLDDILIIPLGVSLAYKLIPKQVLDDHRAKAEKAEIKLGFLKTLFIICVAVVWLLAAALIAAGAVFLYRVIFQ